jgi:hypothetical protein
MVITGRMNLVEGRHADSWTRVIGGKLFMFVHGHSVTYGGNTRKLMTTRSVVAYEVEWDDFEELARKAQFTHAQGKEYGSTRRHAFKADA